ncbi:MAG: hypothetical protein RLZZ546_61 [Bacteroidota bacterium]|jgi:hypothetical protein
MGIEVINKLEIYNAIDNIVFSIKQLNYPSANKFSSDEELALFDKYKQLIAKDTLHNLSIHDLEYDLDNSNYFSQICFQIFNAKNLNLESQLVKNILHPSFISKNFNNPKFYFLASFFNDHYNKDNLDKFLASYTYNNPDHENFLSYLLNKNTHFTNFSFLEYDYKINQFVHTNFGEFILKLGKPIEHLRFIFNNVFKKGDRVTVDKSDFFQFLKQKELDIFSDEEFFKFFIGDEYQNYHQANLHIIQSALEWKGGKFSNLIHSNIDQFIINFNVKYHLYHLLNKELTEIYDEKLLQLSYSFFTSELKVKNEANFYRYRYEPKLIYEKEDTAIVMCAKKIIEKEQEHALEKFLKYTQNADYLFPSFFEYMDQIYGEKQ